MSKTATDADVIVLTAPRSSAEYQAHVKRRRPSSCLTDRPSRSHFKVSKNPGTQGRDDIEDEANAVAEGLTCAGDSATK